jgi:hypothetical protein
MLYPPIPKLASKASAQNTFESPGERCGENPTKKNFSDGWGTTCCDTTVTLERSTRARCQDEHPQSPVQSLREQDRATCRASVHVLVCGLGVSRVGGERTSFPLFGYLATCNQYQHNYHHIFGGFSDPKYTKSGCQGSSP